MTSEEAIPYLDAMMKENKFVFPYREEALFVAISALREREDQRWIPVSERKPELKPCKSGGLQSDAVTILTSQGTVMNAIWDGVDWIGPFDYWDAWGEKVTHWMPLSEIQMEELE